MSNVDSYPFRAEGTPLSPDQAELRKLVYKQVTTDPDSFDMDTYETLAGELVVTTCNGEAGYVTACKTTRCIAGWAQYLARGYMCLSTVKEDATALLGLTAREYYYGPGSCHTGLFGDSNESALRRLRALAGEEAA